MATYFGDATLAELLSDPLTHAVMQADHVNPQELENQLRDLAHRRAFFGPRSTNLDRSVTQTHSGHRDCGGRSCRTDR